MYDGDQILALAGLSVGASWRSRERARRRVLAGGPGQGLARVRERRGAERRERETLGAGAHPCTEEGIVHDATGRETFCMYTVRSRRQVVTCVAHREAVASGAGAAGTFCGPPARPAAGIVPVWGYVQCCCGGEWEDRRADPLSRNRENG